MNPVDHRAVTHLMCLLAIIAASIPAFAEDAAALPDGVKALWDLATAWREHTPTREQVCINGLWRWQPAPSGAEAIPAGHWGYFKVPGCWPGITDYMQKDSQVVHPHPAWHTQDLAGVNAAWYQRTIEAPADWARRRIALAIENGNSLAVVYPDGKKAGEI